MKQKKSIFYLLIGWSRYMGFAWNKAKYGCVPPIMSHYNYLLKETGRKIMQSYYHETYLDGREQTHKK